MGPSTPKHRGPATALTAASCSSGFYKLPSKYLRMPNISAAAGIPARKLFMNHCLNSQGTLLSINYLSPSTGSLGAALFYLQTAARSPALLVRHGGHHSDPGMSQAACPGSQGSALPPIFWSCHHCVGSRCRVSGHPAGVCLQPFSSWAEAGNQGALAAEALSALRGR